MKRVRVIPVLLLDLAGLVKGARFKKHTYVGDPINALKIFNEKEVDEIMLLDISASQHADLNYDRIMEIASEVFMPLAYGGGIRHIDQIQKILQLGAEKVVLNSVLHTNPELVRQASQRFGSQSVIVSIDARKDVWGNYKVWVNCGKINTGKDPVTWAKFAETLGAGELYIQNIDKEGEAGGYDLNLIKMISEAVSIPVIAGAGASSIDDFIKAIEQGKASAVAAGRMFVFFGPHKAVLINYPSQDELQRNFFNKLC